MYRFLKNASSTTGNVNLSKLGTSYSMNYCTLCRKENLSFSGRVLPSNTLFSRNINTEELLRLQNSFKRTKNYRKFKKKYTELLEIKADRSNITKAAVKNLSPKDVSKFTQKPDISLENLHLSLSKNKISPAQEFSKVTVTSDQDCDDLLTQVNLIPINGEEWENKNDAEMETDLIRRNTENVDMFSDTNMESLSNQVPSFFPEPIPAVKKKKERTISPSSLRKKPATSSSKTADDSSNKKLTKALERRIEEERLKKIELQNKNRKFQEYLSSYVEACVHCNFLSMAYNTIYRHLNKHKFSADCLINSPEPFNKLIHGFAGKGNIDKIMEILRMITSCNIGFDLQTFIGCFECLSVLPDTPANKEKSEIILKQFSSSGFTFQDLFTKGTFMKDQREKILKLTQKIDPDFKPSYEPPAYHYSCVF